MRSNRSRTLGLVVAVAAGLMALAAPAAQAVNLNLIDEPGSSGEPGFYLIGGTTTPAGLTHESLGGKLKGENFLFQLTAKSAEISCKKSEVVKGVESFIENEYEDYIAVAAKSGGHGHLRLLFSECVTNEINAEGKLTGKVLKGCVVNPETTPGDITLNFLFLIRRHEGLTYLIFEPLVNSKSSAEASKKLTAPISTLHFSLETCALPSVISLTGGFTAPAPTVDAVKPVFTFETFSAAGIKEQQLLGAKLQFGANEFFVKGELELELTGANAGRSWGAM